MALGSAFRPTIRGRDAQRYWRLQDLQSLLERAALEGPLLMFLDDAQWVDSGTVAALRALPPASRLASDWTVLRARADGG